MRMRSSLRSLVYHAKRHYTDDHESPVPTSRTERFLRLGGLAAGLGIGVAGEAFRRITGIGQQSLLMNRDNVERIVSTLTRMRGAALKLGQMMSLQGIKNFTFAIDNVALPAEAEAILAKVRDAANFMPKWQMEQVMQEELGPDWRKTFEEFHEEPFAAASIGQVHRARLQGKEVVVKVQYPGVKESIVSDLENLKSLLLISQLLPKGLYLDNTIRVAQRELAWETDYEREAKFMSQFGEWLQNDPRFIVPKVHLATKRVLVTDYCPGIPVNQLEECSQEQRDAIVSSILELTLKELFEFRCMQTDPNWSNYLYQSDKIVLLDFGATREFPDAFVEGYGKLLRAAIDNDVAAVEQLSIQLGFLTGLEAVAMRDAHIQATLTLALPFQTDGCYDFGLASSQVIQRIRGLIPTMVNYRLTPPPDESYSLHRKLSGVFLLATKLKARVACRSIIEGIIKE